MRRIELRDGAYLLLAEGWLSEAAARASFAQLYAELPWQARSIHVFGRELLQPRLTAWVGDADAVYTYSGSRHEPEAWTPALSALRERLREELALAFNSVLCNLYRDGFDSMGMHRDAEPELGPNPIVASISLGATRRFVLRHKATRHRSARRTSPQPAQAETGPSQLDLLLSDGTLLVMCGTTQRFYRHGVPKQRGLREPRINLTFRRVLTNKIGISA